MKKKISEKHTEDFHYIISPIKARALRNLEKHHDPMLAAAGVHGFLLALFAELIQLRLRKTGDEDFFFSIKSYEVNKESDGSYHLRLIITIE